MDNTLNSYISRSEEILHCDLHNNEKKFKKYDNEYKTMISFLESTVKKIKDDRANFWDTNNKKLDYTSKIINLDEETNQYYCDIDGLKLRGNIGHIYDRKILQNDRIKAHQVVPCNKKNLCKNILQQSYCKFYHDPADLLILKENHVITSEYYQTAIKYTRNFSNTSWIFSPDPNKYMRSFGSLSTLDNDLKLLELRDSKEDEIKNYKAQVMHDILILKKIESLK